MHLFSWLQPLRTHFRIQSHRSIRSRCKGQRSIRIVEQLEDRTLLAVVTTFEAGQLAVTADAADPIAIGVNGDGELLVNNDNDPTGTGPILAIDVASIDVQGGAGDNNIDLSAVTQSDFTALTGVTISGGTGQDNIIGSEFADVVNIEFEHCQSFDANSKCKAGYLGSIETHFFK